MSFLEPFCGHLSPKNDKVYEKITLRYPHEGPCVVWLRRHTFSHLWGVPDTPGASRAASRVPQRVPLSTKIQILGSAPKRRSDVVCDHQEADAKSRKAEWGKAREVRAKRFARTASPEEDSHERSVAAIMPGHVRKVTRAPWSA